MKSLFTLLAVFALVLGQGTSLASSICRHSSAEAHAEARLSQDSRKAAVAVAEDTADAAASKKGSASNGASGPVLAALLPPSPLAAGIFVLESVLPRATDRPRLVGISLRPPIPPPLA